MDSIFFKSTGNAVRIHGKINEKVSGSYFHLGDRQKYIKYRENARFEEGGKIQF